MWFRKKTPAPMQPPPHPPVGMTPQQFKAAQDAYVEKYAKLVHPIRLIAVEATRLAADFGKRAITFAVLGNAGGLAALVVLAPMMHETNKAWLQQQLWTAVAFAAGAAIAVGVAIIAHFNYSAHAWNMARDFQRNDQWIRSLEFGLNQTWHQQNDAWLAAQQAAANRRADRTNLLSVIAYIAAAGCWIFGAVSMVKSISAAALT